jgi:uncharacterized protein YacL
MRRVLRFLLTLAGIALGIGIALAIQQVLDHFNIILLPIYQEIILTIICGIAFGIILFLLSPSIIKYFLAFLNWAENKLSEVPMPDIVSGSVGLIVGLVIAFLISEPISRMKLPWVSIVLTIAIYFMFAYLGIRIAVKRRGELGHFLSFRRSRERGNKEQERESAAKILDTSVIIDGRIFDICKTGFIEGPLIIPSFVLNELRHIADSSDALKRNRGRRGLDVLNQIQKELDIEVRIHDEDFSDIDEVDVKLLKLGQQFQAKVITNDYNLNKVAEFQGVEVLNINELANAVKPVVLPGEEMIVQVIKDGKETGQGIAYLDDGTMIVVDGGKKYVGETIDVMVTSVLQTAAGRMIFAKPKSVDKVVS